jgi:hypothetical protein
MLSGALEAGLKGIPRAGRAAGAAGDWRRLATPRSTMARLDGKHPDDTEEDDDSYRDE